MLRSTSAYFGERAVSSQRESAEPSSRTSSSSGQSRSKAPCPRGASALFLCLLVVPVHRISEGQCGVADGQPALKACSGGCGPTHNGVPRFVILHHQRFAKKRIRVQFQPVVSQFLPRAVGRSDRHSAGPWLGQGPKGDWRSPRREGP